MNKAIYAALKKPLISEKGTIAKEKNNQYAFEVDKRVSKFEIKKAVEHIFNVTVASVNTAIFKGKVKRVGKSFGKQSGWKKAVVTLKEGDVINFFEGV